MRIGVICPADIAYRRFLPALKKIKNLEFAGVGIYTARERFGDELPEASQVEAILCRERKKARNMVELYGGKLFEGFESMVESKDIDAIYIPLPPALHYKWCHRALEAGKHVMVEKPATDSLKETETLLDLAGTKGLALHENYMFPFHSQFSAIEELLANNALGEVRLYRMAFGFPARGKQDFRYQKNMGGGALLDAGGYPLKCASRLLGESAVIVHAQKNYLEAYDVDIYGSATLVNDKGATAQIAFGMDNGYKCELEVWTSRGRLTAGRIFTAPADYSPEIIINIDGHEEIHKLPGDDAFEKSIRRFLACVENSEVRQQNIIEMKRQAELVEMFQHRCSEE